VTVDGGEISDQSLIEGSGSPVGLAGLWLSGHFFQKAIVLLKINTVEFYFSPIITSFVF